MHKTKTAAAFFAAALLTGCTFGASIDTLMAPPKLSLEQEQIYSALTDAAGGSISLKYPKSGKYLSAFIVEDIDGDGGNEAIVFYEKSSLAAPENTLRISVLDLGGSGKWSCVDDVPADGSEIERVMISKLGNNKRINIIIGSSLINRSEKTATVYTYSDGKLKSDFSQSYSFLDVTDLDSDGDNEFLLFKGASGTDPALAEAYKLDTAGVYHRYSKELSGGFTEFDSIRYGRLENGSEGLYIDAVSGGGNIQTDIVYMDEKGLKKAFASPEDSLATLRPVGCSSYDVDSDGRLEIPVQVIAPGYEEASEGEQLRLTDWLSASESGKTERKYTSYSSVGDGYTFLFPEKWRDKVSVRRDAINDEMVFCAYSDGEMGRELLRIYCAADPASKEDRISAGYMLFRTKGESAYLAYIPNIPDSGDGLTLTAAEAAVGFVCYE